MTTAMTTNQIAVRRSLAKADKRFCDIDNDIVHEDVQEVIDNINAHPKWNLSPVFATSDDDDDDGDNDKCKMSPTESKHRLKIKCAEANLYLTLSNNLSLLNVYAESQKNRHIIVAKESRTAITDAMGKFFRMLYIFELMKCLKFPEKTYSARDYDMSMVKENFKNSYDRVWERIEGILDKNGPTITIIKSDYTRYT